METFYKAMSAAGVNLLMQFVDFSSAGTYQWGANRGSIQSISTPDPRWMALEDLAT